MPTFDFAIPGLMDLQTPRSDAVAAVITRISYGPHLKSNGDWAGVSVGPVLIGGSQPAANAASAVLEFSRNPIFEDVKVTLRSADAEVIIDDAATWEFTVPAQPLELDLGQWYARFIVTDTQGGVYTVHLAKLIIRP